MWKTLKNIVTTKQTEVYNKIEFNGTIFRNMKDIVQKLNNYFVESINEITESIPLRNDCIEIKDPIIKFQEFRLINVDELRKDVFALPNKGSPDEVTIEIYKTVFEEVANPLINL